MPRGVKPLCHHRVPQKKRRGHYHEIIIINAASWNIDGIYASKQMDAMISDVYICGCYLFGVSGKWTPLSNIWQATKMSLRECTSLDEPSSARISRAHSYLLKFEEIRKFEEISFISRSTGLTPKFPNPKSRDQWNAQKAYLGKHSMSKDDQINISRRWACHRDLDA